ncbi:MAG: T9SS type A sorting domain-containing protein, partial [Reichenbachiella sp.]|uniref:T9SS type A sorting domain-containing protein n=1 Tax=Reichenbachiella sp. TaxID=2184521 RepID=UPI003296DB59
FEVEASSTSELEVTLTVTGPATIDGATITLDGIAGTVTVFANQAGNDEFEAAEEVSVTFEVTEPVVNAVSNYQLDIQVYPNPASEWITVKGLTSQAELQLINLDGQLMKQQTINSSDRIDVSTLSKGVYVLRVSEENSYTTTKILIH